MKIETSSNSSRLKTRKAPASNFRDFVEFPGESGLIRAVIIVISKSINFRPKLDKLAGRFQPQNPSKTALNTYGLFRHIYPSKVSQNPRLFFLKLHEKQSECKKSRKNLLFLTFLVKTDSCQSKLRDEHLLLEFYAPSIVKLQGKLREKFREREFTLENLGQVTSEAGE